MRRRCLALVSLVAVSAAATPARAQATGPRLRGRVFDSVASAPLAGARIELVSEVDRSRIAYSATSDSLGHFSLPAVARGRYIAGFFHPVLDSLGLALSQRWLDVKKDDGEMGFDLAIPSAERVHQAICAPQPKPKGVLDSAGVVMGYVLSAHSLMPQTGATVIAQWTEYTIGRGTLERQLFSRTATSVPGGWFAVCDVPSAADIVVRAINGTDTSGAIEVRVPGNRLARRTLYVASRETLAAAAERDSVVKHALRATSDSATDRPAAAVSGTVLNGWVRTEDGVPIASAQVRLYGSSITALTNHDGAFVLVGVPGGSQTLVTRALGFVPDERPVDLTDEHLPVIIGLTSVRRFIDTVHVRAARLDINNIVGFESRRKAGSGRFFSAADIRRLSPRQVTDILRHAPSVQLVSQGLSGFAVRMRGDRNDCQPALFLDGKQLVRWELADLNSLLHPDEIGGMEIYTPSMTPAEFRTQDACGTILIWTRPPERLSRR
jgi:hypothetical protein